MDYQVGKDIGALAEQTEQHYQQVLAWAKEQLAQQQQTIARLTSRLEQLEKKTSPMDG